MQVLAILFALLAGGANPFQSGTNAELKTHLAQPLWATVWVYLSGLLGVLLVQAFVRQPLPSGPQTSSAPWWAWTGGLISIVATFAGLMLAQKLGSGVSLTLDHFGLIGFKQHTASPMRMAGGALMVLGIWMVTRF